ncbi:hypothetical protein J4464_04010 [Candidatus Woesearchaeota archaeon]|nr:hypothetical protein [Candidatus Woesearchaeota archaeon]
MNKPVKIAFSPDALKTYVALLEKARTSKQERALRRVIDAKIELIKANPRYGNPVAKYLIPKVYWLKYRIPNLYRIHLPFYWRMLYSLTQSNEVEILGFILEIIDHKEYDKRFGYR